MSTFNPFYDREVFETIWNAINDGHTDIVDLLFRESPSLINVAYIDGVGYRRTLLHQAVCEDNVVAARWLVDHGLPVDAMCERDNVRVRAALVGQNWGMAPIHLAALYSAEPKTLRFLVEAGADINEKGDHGWTPLHLAVWDNPNPDIAEYLVSAGADTTARDDEGSTPYECDDSYLPET